MENVSDAITTAAGRVIAGPGRCARGGRMYLPSPRAGQRPALGNFPRSATRVVGIAFLALGTLAASPAAAAKHPGLVDPTTAKCATCHAKVLSNKVQHFPAVDDCRGCHEFSKKDGQTSVELSAPLPALCVTCHEGFAKAADGTLAAPHAPVVDSCTNCHDPHSTAEPRLLKSTVPGLCVACHAAAEIDKSHTVTVSRGDCRGCHASHGSAMKGMLVPGTQHPPFAERTCVACHRKSLGGRVRLQAEGAALCFACHSDLDASFAKGSVHGAVKQGKCVGCHSPHLAAEGKLLKAKGADLCVGCHQAIGDKAKGKGAHAPVKEDCDTCHEPHRSDVPGQLTAKVPDLCLTCHDATDKALAAKHLGADLAKLVCTSCHDPHGSESKALLAAVSVHPPVLDGCDSCHEGAAGKLVENGSKALCYACHSDIQEFVAKAKFPHAALDAAECVACHSPHASAQAKLLNAPGGGVCLTCHEDKGPAVGEVGHGVVDAIGCQACHEPHGGAREKLLRAGANELCLGCHDARNTKPAAGKGTVTLLGRFTVPVAVAKGIKPVQLAADGQHNHPVTAHRAIGMPTKDELARTTVTFTGELGCLSCHDPHKSANRSLLRANRAECSSCHPQ